MLYLDTDYIPNVGNEIFPGLEESSDTIFILDNRFILRGFNSAWEEFAQKNRGESILSRWHLGSRVLDAFSEPLKSHYKDLYEKTLESGLRTDAEYECSSDQFYRKYRQSLHPLPEKSGLIISNHLEIERPHDEPPVQFADRHRNREGMLVQCCHCRRTRDHLYADKWDWIPEFVRAMPQNTSHGFCSRCIEFYYPELALKLKNRASSLPQKEV